jgi:hypothetical protein
MSHLLSLYFDFVCTVAIHDDFLWDSLTLSRAKFCAIIRQSLWGLQKTFLWGTPEMMAQMYPPDWPVPRNNAVFLFGMVYRSILAWMWGTPR